MTVSSPGGSRNVRPVGYPSASDGDAPDGRGRPPTGQTREAMTPTDTGTPGPTPPADAARDRLAP